MIIKPSIPWARFIVCLDAAGEQIPCVVEVDTESLQGERMVRSGGAWHREEFWAASVAFSRYTPDAVMDQVKRGFPELDALTRVGAGS